MLERVGQRRMHDFERDLPGLKRQQCEAEGAQVRTPAAGADGFLLQTKPKTVQYCFVPRKWLLDSLMLEPLRCCYGQKNRTYRKARRLRVYGALILVLLVPEPVCALVKLCRIRM